MIRFSMYYDGDRKINAIKNLRTATGCGLEEAKDCVEDYSHRPITMTHAQFAKFMVGVFNCSAGAASEWNIRDIMEVEPQVEPYDFTKQLPLA